VDGELWARVQTRLRAVREAYGATNQQKRPRGQAPEVYSPHLLSGLMRCAICGARITIQSSQRKKNGTVYRYGRYRCSFHVTKGPAVCTNAMSIPQPVLEAKLLAKFQAALSSDMIDYLVVATNEMLRQLWHDAAGDPYPHPGAAGGRAPAVEPRRVRGEGGPLVASTA
jgi:hypothetical protein